MILVSKIQIPTLPTKKDRRLYVYLPKEYEKTDERYPVLYMFDGHNVFYNSHATYGKSWGMKEYLTRTHLPLIVVAVECNHEGNQRLSEYSPYDFNARGMGRIEGRGKETMDWIVNELKPYIDETYRTIPDREHTMIAGSSMGGLMALYAVVAYNEVFSRAAALSPSIMLCMKEVRSLIAETKLQKTTRVYMDVGSTEVPENRRGRGLLADLFDTAARLTKGGAQVAAQLVTGAAHCEADWEKRIPVFMDYLGDDL